MRIETFAILLFAAWFVSEPIILRTARDRSGSDVDRRSMVFLATCNSVLPWLSIALYLLGPGNLVLGTACRATGLALMMAGFGIRWAGMWTLRSYFSANVAVQADQRLVLDGPYRVVRHPGYFGGWLAFTGLGLALGNGIAMLCLTVLTVPAFLYRIRVEERILRSAFPAYPAYASRVKRFIPFVW